MLKHKTFLKKTRRGKVVKIVREHYLRDDIPCGAQNCSSSGCGGGQDGEPTTLLEEHPGSNGNHLFNGDHYLILDTNIVLNQIDLIESEGLK